MTNAPFFYPRTRINQSPRHRLQKWIVFIVGMIFLCGMGAEIARAASNSGLPLPRFVSLRKDQVNVRTGPGVRYPVDWIFVYKNMPVEILAEFKAWRKVRDWTGTIGWVHRSMLSGKYRWVIIRTKTEPLRREAKPDAPVIAKLEKKVIGRLIKCHNDWCEVTVNGIQGWTQRTALWGVYANEKN